MIFSNRCSYNPLEQVEHTNFVIGYASANAAMANALQAYVMSFVPSVKFLPLTTQLLNLRLNMTTLKLCGKMPLNNNHHPLCCRLIAFNEFFFYTWSGDGRRDALSYICTVLLSLLQSIGGVTKDKKNI